MARKLAFDRLLFGSVVLLVFLGLLMIYSASAMQIYLPTSAAPAGAYFFVIKQTIAVVIGAVLAEPRGTVLLKSRIGGQRIVDLLAGEQLPRIC